MIHLLLQLAYIALLLAVISLFVCILPVWLIVLVVVPEESEQLRRKVACLLDAAGNENLDL